MSDLMLDMRGFGGIASQQCTVPCREEHLLRGVIAAGQSPRSLRRCPAARSHVGTKIGAIRTAVEFNGADIEPSEYFMGLASTQKSVPSFHVGNAMCAHAAYEVLNINWLCDYEALPDWVTHVRKPNADRKPDYLGLDTSGNWHVFESKGRSTGLPSDSTIQNEFKPQAQSIQSINGSAPVSEIVSVAYVNGEYGTWDLAWIDPEDDEGLKLELPKSTYFLHAYEPVMKLLAESEPARTDRFDGQIAYIEALDVTIGLDSRVSMALLREDAPTIVEFARRFDAEESTPEMGATVIEIDGRRRLTRFADGLAVGIGDLRRYD